MPHPLSRNQNKEQTHYLGGGWSLHVNGSRTLVITACHVALLHRTGRESTLCWLPSHLRARRYYNGVILEFVSVGTVRRRVSARACATIVWGGCFVQFNDCCVLAVSDMLVPCSLRY
jgi:hypothetical protein